MTPQTQTKEPDPELARLQRGALPKDVFAAFNKAVERMGKTGNIHMLHMNAEMITMAAIVYSIYCTVLAAFDGTSRSDIEEDPRVN